MATYSAQCSAVGSFSYANYFKLYVVLTETDVSIANNTSKVQYNVYCQSSGSGSISAKHLKYFNLNGSDIINTTETVNVSSPNAYIAIASGTTSAITHNNDGSKSVPFSAQIKASSYGVSASVSGTFTLSTIARASSVSGGSGNIGSTSTISISRASNSFTHTLRYAFGSLSGTIATGVGTSYTWTIPTSFYAQIPSAKSGTGTIYCDTYSGSTLIGTKSVSFTATASESSCRPTVSATIKDTNSTTTALTGNSSKLVKYKSTAQLVITSTVKNSATIKSVTVNGVSVGTSSSITKTYSNVSTTSFTIVTTDSRGYTNTSYVVTPSYVNYVPLTVNANFFRPQPTTGEVQLTYSGNYFNGSFGSASNTLSITWNYKVQGTTEWTTGGTITPTLSGNTISSKTISLGTSFDYQTAYDFQLTAVDKLTTVTRNASVSVGMPVFHWGKDFMSVNVRLKANTYFLGVKNPACWVYIGEIELGSQGSYAVLDCYMGDGQNGRADQNTHARILLKQGWTGASLPIGITTRFTQNYKSSIKVKISHISLTKCKLYMYLPFSYSDLTYVINGSHNLFTPSNTVLSEEPTTDKESTYYKDYEPVSLYDNSSGTTGTVTLSETSANFSYIEIFYSESAYSTAGFQSIKIHNPNGKSANLTWSTHDSSCIIFRSARYSISGTSLSRASETQYNTYNTTAKSVTDTYIYKVIGYR